MVYGFMFVGSFTDTDRLFKYGEYKFCIIYIPIFRIFFLFLFIFVLCLSLRATSIIIIIWMQLTRKNKTIMTILLR